MRASTSASPASADFPANNKVVDLAPLPRDHAL